MNHEITLIFSCVLYDAISHANHHPPPTGTHHTTHLLRVSVQRVDNVQARVPHRQDAHGWLEQMTSTIITSRAMDEAAKLQMLQDMQRQIALLQSNIAAIQSGLRARGMQWCLSH